MRQAVADRRPFQTYGALSAPDYVPIYTGYLPGDWARTYTARRHVIDYVVLSYNTPIAWHDTEAGWVVPDVHYSRTTSVHQSRVRFAISGGYQE